MGAAANDYMVRYDDAGAEVEDAKAAMSVTYRDLERANREATMTDPQAEWDRRFSFAPTRGNYVRLSADGPCYLHTGQAWITLTPDEYREMDAFAEDYPMGQYLMGVVEWLCHRDLREANTAKVLAAKAAGPPPSAPAARRTCDYVRGGPQAWQCLDCRHTAYGSAGYPPERACPGAPSEINCRCAMPHANGRDSDRIPVDHEFRFKPLNQSLAKDVDTEIESEPADTDPYWVERGVQPITVDAQGRVISDGHPLAPPLTACASCGAEFRSVRVGVCLPGYRRCFDCAPLPTPPPYVRRELRRVARKAKRLLREYEIARRRAAGPFPPLRGWDRLAGWPGLA